MTIKSDMQVGYLHSTSNFGNLEILEYMDARNVRVRFINTGYITIAEAGHIRKGSVKDKLIPTVCNVGFIGGDNYSTKDTVAYIKWRDMLKRCYNPGSRDSNYKNITVHNDWHNFQNFAEWHYKHYKSGLVLDKDCKIENSTTYSKETCSYITEESNIQKANAGKVEKVFISPCKGFRVTVTNQSEFARKFKLSQSSISAMIRGKQKEHKGWTLDD